MSRRMLLQLLPASVVILILSAAAAGAQGLYWESKMTGGPPGVPEQTSKVHAVPGLFKQSMEEQGFVTLVRTKGEIVQGIDPAKKTYWELTFKEMEEQMKGLEAQMDAAFAQLEKQLEGLPPEQRKVLEKQLGGQKAFLRKSAGKIEVTGTAEKKTIAGYEATKHVIKEDGKEVGAIWTSKDVKGFKPLEKDLADMMKRMSSMSPVASKMSEAYLKIEGFPLETDMGGMKTTVTKIEERAIPASEFEVPKDYKKEDSPFSRIPGGPPGQGFGPPRKKAKAE